MDENGFYVLVCAGPFACQDTVKTLLTQNKATLIAVDKGFDYLSPEFVPTLSIGDFDSTQTPVEVIREKSANTILLPEEKDKTDFEEAIEYAFNNNGRKIAVFGALGGERLDLSVNNLQVAQKYAVKGCSIIFYDEKATHKMALIASGRELLLPTETPIDSLVSVLALTDQATVDIADLKYEFSGVLRADSSRGIANQTVENKAGKIVCREGVVAVYHRT